MASVKNHIQEVSDTVTRRALYALLEAVRTDLNSLATSVSGVTAQLDADAGVTDTDYAANNDPTLTVTE
jgi:hypothetical protein